MKNNDIIAYCAYCKRPIYESDEYIEDPETGKFYHYSKENPLENCYYEDYDGDFDES